jgi:hypothetical protein
MSVVLPRTQRWLWTPGLLIFLLATIAALAPSFLSLPFPETARTFAAATVSLNDGAERAVDLPHDWSRSYAPAGPAQAVYRFDFELEDIPETDQYLLVRSVRLQMSTRLNQARLKPAAGALWINPVSGSTPVMVIPRHYFLAGSNELEITLERFNGGALGHLSRLYLGGEAEIGPIDYPDSYASPARFIGTAWTGVRDPAAPGDPDLVEWYCDTCSFRPWIDFGEALGREPVDSHTSGRIGWMPPSSSASEPRAGEAPHWRGPPRNL